MIAHPGPCLAIQVILYVPVVLSIMSSDRVATSYQMLTHQVPHQAHPTPQLVPPTPQYAPE